MENSGKIKGIFPALLTPFNKDCKLDFEGLEKLVERLYQSGVQGLFVGGNMGEWYTQTMEERKSVAAQAIALSKTKGQVVLHVGCARMEDTLELARFAEKIGASAIASLPPYLARLQEKDVLSYFHCLSQTTSLPLFIYYHPTLTGYQLSGPLLEMIESSPNIQGVKYTDYDLLNLANLIELRNRRLNIMNGHDQILFPSLLLGASGGIGSFYNIIPKAFVQVYNDMAEGKVTAARSLQQQINQFITVVKRCALIPAFKYILQLKGIGAEEFRVTLQPLDEEQKNKMKNFITENDFFDQWAI